MGKRKPARRPVSLQTKVDSTKISILISSVYYFLDFVFIMAERDCFRLVVIHNRRLLTYKKYKTVKSAKIGFSRLYSHKAWKEGLKPNWSVFYNPTTEWLDERREIIKKYTQ